MFNFEDFLNCLIYKAHFVTVPLLLADIDTRKLHICFKIDQKYIFLLHIGFRGVLMSGIQASVGINYYQAWDSSMVLLNTEIKHAY